MEGTHVQRALSGLLGDDAESAEFFDWEHAAAPPSMTWGVRPPLPGLDPSLELDAATPGMRIEPNPRDAWSLPDNRDPSNADAPGRPAMDEPT
jgi:hypothetical protein